MKFTVAAILGLAAISQAQPLASPIIDLGVDLDLGLRNSKGNSKGDRKGNGRSGKSPFYFTTTYAIHATPEEVVDSNNQFSGGLKGATGVFKFGINSHENVICYNITISGFQGEYASPAVTATHIHEAPQGKAGPPRIAFPNPVEVSENIRSSIGCIRGPFKTGVVTNGKDSGDGFHVKQIEENPSSFFTDVHSSLAVPGAVRGQLDQKHRK